MTFWTSFSDVKVAVVIGTVFEREDDVAPFMTSQPHVGHFLGDSAFEQDEAGMVVEDIDGTKGVESGG